MPLYEFECKSCEYKFELIQGYNVSAKCPKCGAIAKRLISVVNHTFGWRPTDRSNERFGPRDEYEKDT